MKHSEPLILFITLYLSVINEAIQLLAASNSNLQIGMAPVAPQVPLKTPQDFPG